MERAALTVFYPFFPDRCFIFLKKSGRVTPPYPIKKIFDREKGEKLKGGAIRTFPNPFRPGGGRGGCGEYIYGPELSGGGAERDERRAV